MRNDCLMGKGFSVWGDEKVTALDSGGGCIIR